jgi:hypothetical protein
MVVAPARRAVADEWIGHRSEMRQKAPLRRETGRPIARGTNKSRTPMRGSRARDTCSIAPGTTFFEAITRT